MQEQPTGVQLKELLSKSWNLEMLISGAAIVFVTALPEQVEDMYFLQEQSLGFNFENSLAALPLLAYAFLKVISWLILGALVTHLVMRAFWVALIGLLAAFPEGIQFDKLPNMGAASRNLYREKLGNLDQYVVRLDRYCSQVLAFAFLQAMMGIGIGIAYNVMFWTSQWLKSVVQGDILNTSIGIFGFTIAGLSVVFSVLNARMKKNEALNERYGPMVARTTWYMSSAILGFLMRPVSYISMVFMSNIPPRRFYTSYTVISVAMMVGVFVVFSNKIGQTRQISLLEPRNFYSQGSNSNSLKAAHYDNLRTDKDYIPPVSIPADIIEDEAFLRVFVAYPMSLDATLSQHCTVPQMPDDWRKSRKSYVRDSTSLACLQTVIRLSVNDSTYVNPKWLFHEKSGRMTAKGLLTYVPTAAFESGYNLLKIQIPSETNRDSLIVYGQVPFWVK
jgi:hypothetical protein